MVKVEEDLKAVGEGKAVQVCVCVWRAWELMGDVRAGGGLLRIRCGGIGGGGT